MLSVNNLTKVFTKVKAVDQLSFELKEGRICGFVGPNGAGKTTTMRIIATLDEATSGEVFVDQLSIREHPYKIRRMIGFMPDHYGTYPALTVRDYMEFYARAYEINSGLREQRVLQIMDFTGLDKIAEKKVEALSKGMRQRLNLGRALINDPRLLVMDEPAAGLDPRARVELRFLIKNLAERGKTVFVSSHILTELGEICEDILIIDKGRLIMYGDIGEIRKKMQKTVEISVRLLTPEKVKDLEKYLLERKGVRDVRITTEDCVSFSFLEEMSLIPGFIQEMMNAGFPVVEFNPRLLTMEDVFIQITEGEF